MAQYDFLPLIILFLFGGFAVLSALLKTRARVKAFLSIAFILMEGFAGVALMATALPTSGSLEAASRMGIIVALLVALSSTVHLVKVRERNRAREASEGKRLYASIRYGIDASAMLTGESLLEPDAPVDQGGAVGDLGHAGDDLRDADSDLGEADDTAGDANVDPGDANVDPGKGLS